MSLNLNIIGYNQIGLNNVKIKAVGIKKWIKARKLRWKRKNNEKIVDPTGFSNGH